MVRVHNEVIGVGVGLNACTYSFASYPNTTSKLSGARNTITVHGPSMIPHYRWPTCGCPPQIVQ